MVIFFVIKLDKWKFKLAISMAKSAGPTWSIQATGSTERIKQFLQEIYTTSAYNATLIFKVVFFKSKHIAKTFKKGYLLRKF